MKRLHITVWLILLTIAAVWPGPIQSQPDVFQTDEGPLLIHPVLHATMVIEWNGSTIYVDPYGGAAKFKPFSKADLVIITDIHGDHLHLETLSSLDLSQASVIVPPAASEQLADLAAAKVFFVENGEELSWEDIQVEAIPMYNLPETSDSRHPKGRGNGYVLSMGGTRLYISGDTEDIPEMRALRNIDIAFVCMNLPFTMDIDQAASAVVDFAPTVVFPFHYRGGGGVLSDVEAFKRKVEEQSDQIEVRIRDWYNIE